jgi:hypothetical protein
MVAGQLLFSFLAAVWCTVERYTLLFKISKIVVGWEVGQIWLVGPRSGLWDRSGLRAFLLCFQ